MTRAVTAYLALGTNLGDRMSNLRHAARLLRHSEGIEVEAVARVYETEPVGVAEQPWFLNSAVKVRTTLSPHGLLAAGNRIEAEVGRTRTFRWGPREIDVDILLYDEISLDDPDLTIPHPRMTERLFVLLPLRDVHPSWRDASGIPIDELVERLRGAAQVHPYPEHLE